MRTDMDEQRKAFEAWQLSRKPSYPAEWEAWQAATLVERERAAKVSESKYCDLSTLRHAARAIASDIRKG